MSEMTRRDWYRCAYIAQGNGYDDASSAVDSISAYDATLAAAGEETQADIDLHNALVEKDRLFDEAHAEIARLKGELDLASKTLVQYIENENGQIARLRAELDSYKRPLTEEQVDIVSEQVRIEDDDPRRDVDLMREIDAAIRKVRSREVE